MSVVVEVAEAVLRSVYRGPAGTDAEVRRVWHYQPTPREKLPARLITVIPPTAGYRTRRDTNTTRIDGISVLVILEQPGAVDNLERGDEWANYIETVIDRFAVGTLATMREARLLALEPLMLREEIASSQAGVFKAEFRLTYQVTRRLPPL